MRNTTAFYLWWMIGTVLGWAVVWAPLPGSDNFLLMTAANSGGPTSTSIFTCLIVVIGSSVGVVGGCVMGVGQWLALRRGLPGHQSVTARWGTRTILGMVYGSGLSLIVVTIVLVLLYGVATANEGTLGNFVLILPGAVAAAVVGLVTSYAQSRLLDYSQRGPWMRTSVIAWGISGAIFWTVYALLIATPWDRYNVALNGLEYFAIPDELTFTLASLLGWGLGGVVLGAVTGRHILRVLSVARTEPGETA